ncbi:hypothetical protein NP493_5915g00002 [Ridgeia piscesae]|uniref:Uncharacterized protein n=1 Tax=Ridgeia piscesae TaxID=27915 RepID=A0AAD9MN52_RIDPI|nr:hypothetical protein NP493_5915g00002 [Ridgeia piscesae]
MFIAITISRHTNTHTKKKQKTPQLNTVGGDPSRHAPQHTNLDGKQY